MPPAAQVRSQGSEGAYPGPASMIGHDPAQLTQQSDTTDVQGRLIRQ